MAVEGGCSCIIKDCLIRNSDVEYSFQNSGGFSGRDSERDIERQYKAKDIFRIMDFREIDSGFLRR